MAENDVDEVTFTIKYNRQSGHVTFDGPVADPLLCYGLLEVAKDFVRASMVQAARQQQIARPTIDLAKEFLRGR